MMGISKSGLFMSNFILFLLFLVEVSCLDLAGMGLTLLTELSSNPVRLVCLLKKFLQYTCTCICVIMDIDHV